MSPSVVCISGDLPPPRQRSQLLYGSHEDSALAAGPLSTPAYERQEQAVILYRHMFQPTRLINTLGVFWGNFNTRLRATNQNLAFHLFCLVSGFFIGNIFGTFLLTLRVFFRWDIFIILGFIAISEFISFQTYKRPKPAVDLNQVKFFYWRPLNLVKLGCLFGFFVDAFKVGS